jgi:hypothetical protein
LDQHAEGVQIGRLLRIVDSGGAASRSGIGVLIKRLDHRDDGAILQKRQLACSEVIEQRSERLGPDSHLGVQSPAQARVKSPPTAGSGGHGGVRGGDRHGQ